MFFVLEVNGYQEKRKPGDSLRCPLAILSVDQRGEKTLRSDVQ